MQEGQRKTILIIEDELDIQEMITFNLRNEGFRVLCSGSGEDGLDKAEKRLPEMILLDLMLPGINGLEVCRRIRRNKELDDTKIIMLTAKGEEADVVSGLELGADDYVTKPFSNRVLLARIHALFRRDVASTEMEVGEVLEFDGLSIHPGRHEVLVDQAPVELTSSEFKALYLMASRPGWVFSRYQIVDGVHGPGHVVTGRTIDVLMVSLRKKLQRFSACIETVRGAGYRFKQP
jgi:two-component system, OmpR family, alkaline phosphatase synthesis response regulator PhoP